jgi:hypothetical protein
MLIISMLRHGMKAEPACFKAHAGLKVRKVNIAVRVAATP